MAKAVVIYYSRTGTTKAMAELISKGIREEGLEVDLKKVEDIKPQELLDYDAIVIGSPTYYGTMAYQIKKLLDDSVKFHGSLDGKVGAAFSSSANIGGGNETTILNIIEAMLIHGMIIQGDPQGDHYGAVAVGSVDNRAEKQCLRLAKRVAHLVKRLKG
ncbi:MAG: flavodoxin domain-containing protein [Candidatus Omnitrophica bacterium]|nr:flavodoxin domain-containing protein [Candidatus Omnitrophota bacterium]